jgi:hypothetical protein
MCQPFAALCHEQVWLFLVSQARQRARGSTPGLESQVSRTRERVATDADNRRRAATKARNRPLAAAKARYRPLDRAP